MAIKIYCDLCGSEREMNQIRGVETLKGGSSVWFNEPRMDHEHFVCTGCLAKIGVETAEEKSNRGNRENGGNGENCEQPRTKEVRRRRGVAVVLYWKNGNGFEVCNSIAAAVDRIVEKTGTVIQGADISHALLKERVFNTDEVCVRYAAAQGETDENGTATLTRAERMETETATQAGGTDENGAAFGGELTAAL